MSVTLGPEVCTPTYWHVPQQRAGSHLRAVEGVIGKLGRTLDPTQRFAVDVLTSAKADGAPAGLSAAVICPRQNLKTYVLEGIVLTRLLRPGGDKLAVWSAHEVSTATETFRAFVEYAEAEDSRGRPLYPWFADRVAGISRATGRESITFRRRLRSGRVETCRLKFKARVKTGGRGLAGDLVILDEAFALEPAHMGSLLPILSTKAKGQIIYGSSAPHATSVILHDVILRGRAGLMPYLEWRAPGSLAEPGCARARCSHEPGTPGCFLDNLGAVIACNPAAFHGRIPQAYLEGERLELRAAPEEYARERLGWGEDAGAAGGTIPLGAWNDRADAASQIEGQRVIAVEVATDAGSSAIAGAGYRADGGEHLALVDHRPGTSWAVPRVVELLERRDVGAVVVDPGAPGAMLLPDLRKAGLTIRTEANPAGEIVLMTVRDAGAAAGMLKARIAGDEPSAWHRGDLILQQALKASGRRPIGNGGWGFDRRGEDDITPIVAVAEALWGLVVGALPDVTLFVGDDAGDQATDGEAPADGGRDPEYPNQFHVEPVRERDDCTPGQDDEDGGDVAAWIG